MAAWIGPSWQEERRGLVVDDEEGSRRRMVELLLGPFLTSKTCRLQPLDREQQPTTLDLLPAANGSSPPARENMGCTHIELEPEMPLPSGWEKCLNLKTGSIYYLNRTTGTTSASDPRKLASLDNTCSRIDANTSPTTSELTVEAFNEAICNSKASHDPEPLKINEKLNSNAENELDLNLTLHVGLCSSPKACADAGISILHPSSAASPIAKSKVSSSNASAPSASTSSSSSTSSPLSASLAFSQTILSSKELSQPSSSSFLKQNTSVAVRGSLAYSSGMNHTLSDYVQSTGGTMSLQKPVVESEDVSTPAAAAMVTAACANCLMFVMLSRSNPRCPRCGSSCPEQMDFPRPPLKRAKLGFSF